MSYQTYYENMEPDRNDPKPKKSHVGKVLLQILLILVVFAVIGMLVAGIVQSIHQGNGWDDFSDLLPESTPPALFETPKQSAVPALPTPLPTSRPMIGLDGEAPSIFDNVNPIPDIAEGVAESIVGVENYVRGFGSDEPKELQGTGSGFLVSSEGYILTNAHVVAGAERLMVTLTSGEEIEAEVLGADPYMDVAVLKIAKSGLRALKMGDSSALRVGEYVIAVGNPLGRELEGSVTMGIVSARARDITIDGITNSYIQTDAAINFGNSGGPLLNMRGEVVGINTAKSVYAGYDAFGNAINAEGLGFALPIHDVTYTMEQLIMNGYVMRPALGITVVTLTGSEAQRFGMESGVLVYAVVEGGPAGAAGILPDDMLLRCDGIALKDQDTLTDLIDQKQVGDTLELELLRDGQTLTITVTVGDRNTLNYDIQQYGSFAEQPE